MCLKLKPWILIGSAPVRFAVFSVLVVEAVAADVQPQVAREDGGELIARVETGARALLPSGGGLVGPLREHVARTPARRRLGQPRRADGQQRRADRQRPPARPAYASLQYALQDVPPHWSWSSDIIWRARQLGADRDRLGGAEVGVEGEGLLPVTAVLAGVVGLAGA